MKSSGIVKIGGALLASFVFSIPAQTTGKDEPAVPRFSTNYLDRSVAPGKDFYLFADGNWIKNNPVPADKSRWTSFGELAERGESGGVGK